LSLKSATGGTTNLIVAQRIGTIMDADKIIVLENGEICGIGTHKDLLDTCEVYKEIVESQLTEEEMGDEIA
jgi:ATP-binding cassette subfamily B protein